MIHVMLTHLIFVLQSKFEIFWKYSIIFVMLLTDQKSNDKPHSITKILILNEFFNV